MHCALKKVPYMKPLLLLLPLLSCWLILSADTGEELKDYQLAADNEEVSREKVETEAAMLARNARVAFEIDDYPGAIRHYLAAVEKLTPFKANARISGIIQNIQQNMAVVYHYWGRDTAARAQKDADEGAFDDAIAKCMNAMDIDPSLRPSMENLIRKYEAMKKNTAYTNEKSEKSTDPTKEQRLYEIDILMLQGEKLYQQSLWHRAREKFEQVLVIDPYNLQAIEGIRKLTKQMYDAGKRRYEVTQEERNAEVEWNYVSPLIARSLTPSEKVVEPLEKRQEKNKVREKLKNIIIDHMTFEDASIAAVINLLRVRAKDLDPQKEGINIFLRLDNATPAASDTGPAPAAADDDGGFLFDDVEAEDDILADAGIVGERAENTITIMFNDLSLEDAIRNICIAANMNYRVEEYAVVMAPKTMAMDSLETRIYPVESQAFEEIGAAAAGAAGEGAVTEGGTTSVKDFFVRRGVPFPDQARIVYDAAISRLIATNTDENLKLIEQIIDELNVLDPQVLIESKFVEIQENKTDELGFEWALSRANPDPAVLPHTYYFAENDQLLRFDNQNRLGGNDEALRIDRTVSGYNMTLRVRAMDIMDRVDLLSCPRITTQNGEEAIIRMVQEEYYPESWGETTVISGTPGIGFSASMPEFGEPEEMGVRLTVTPTVDPDNYTIHLDMIPAVRSFITWVDYSYDVPTEIAGGVTVTVPNVIRMPIFEARTVQTQITVYDGETVVMGGIMRDTTNTVDDRIPILGDLPLIGRAFRSKYIDKAKANLIIFTTVRLVNPDGSPLREREVRGKPPFRM
ncbi:MAG: hypothetical protein JW808_11250 [Victivallales bacterium]|nr:hypothetical protein [Victivallales bacterium]